MLASKRNGGIDIAVTSDSVRRIRQHGNDVVEGFTHRHGVHIEVWFGVHPTMESAMASEKASKNWQRR